MQARKRETAPTQKASIAHPEEASKQLIKKSRVARHGPLHARAEGDLAQQRQQRAR
jgi:hypothetical protein